MSTARFTGIGSVRVVLAGALLAAALVVGLMLTLVAAERPAGAAFPGENGRIAFVRGINKSFEIYNNSKEIYTMRSDGTGVRRLTDNSLPDSNPTWSPDGSKIAFSRDRTLRVMDADGSNKTNLNEVGWDPAWSPDGSKIAFVRGTTDPRNPEDSAIYVKDLTGGGTTKLTTPSRELGNERADYGPAWSPDGTRIAFTRYHTGYSSGSIWAVNADGSGESALSIWSAGYINLLPDWSPDGTKIAFTCMVDPDEENFFIDICVTAADGSRSGQSLTTAEYDYSSDAAWSPDGTSIVFRRNYDLWTMNADGSDQRNLTNTDASYVGRGAKLESEPDWQPLPPAYDFGGFFAPVNNPPTLNVLNAGRGVPVAFSLGGDQGADIFAQGYPTSRRIVCSASAPKDAVERTVSAGESTLSYDAATERYTYAWKTKGAWEGTCRKLVVKLDDGSVHRANFKFK